LVNLSISTQGGIGCSGDKLRWLDNSSGGWSIIPNSDTDLDCSGVSCLQNSPEDSGGWYSRTLDWEGEGYYGIRGEYECTGVMSNQYSGVKEIFVDGGNAPQITWENPTPEDDTTVNENNAYLNTTINDSSEISSFFDWNYDLKGYWNFEDYNSSGIYDNSSYNNFATFNGNISESNISTGKFGNSLEFNGNDDYLKVNAFYNFTETNFTVMLWGKIETPTGIKTALSQQDGDGTGRSWIIFNDNTCEDGKIATYLGGTILCSNITASVDEWYHVAISYDGTTLKVYVNGEEEASDTRIVDENATGDLIIGQHKGLTNYKFDGELDEVSLFSRTLDSNEIKASYDNNVNRLYHNFTNLNEGTYDYCGYSIDMAGNSVKSCRNVTISVSAFVTNETEARGAIEEGINNSILNNPEIITDQKIYLRYVDNTQKLGSFDKFITNNDQTWVFNYISSEESDTNLTNIGNIVNVWEERNLTYSEIVNQVEGFINSTFV